MRQVSHFKLTRLITRWFRCLIISALLFGSAIQFSYAYSDDTTTDDKSVFISEYDASLWLLKMSQRLEKYVKEDHLRLEILRHVYLEAEKNQLNPNFVLSVMHVESFFDPNAISSAGAQGLMQVMPFWKKEIGTREDNLKDIQTNIRYGCAILKTYLLQEEGNSVRALARYNGSIGQTWYAARVFRAWKDYWALNG